jgi:hypothetical protein
MSVYRYVDTQILEVRNPLFTVNSNITTSSPVDAVDIGFFGQYYNGTSVLSAGLFRDHTDGIFKLFSGVSGVIDPATIVGTGATGFTYGSLTINDLVAQGNATINGNLTVLGSQVILGTQTVTTTDNLIAVNTSPSAIMTDGGLVSKRYPTAVTTNDTAKQSGTASTSGTTTTATLQAANGHGTTLNYYKGWIIKFGGGVTGVATVTGSTASNPPVLTFGPAASGSTTTSTTYQLYNKAFTGPIWQEATQRMGFFGIPYESLAGVVSSTDPNGNLSDYVDVGMNSAYVNNNLYVTGYIGSQLNTTDNIVVANYNAGLADGGFVTQRSAVNVATDDTPLISNVAIQTNYVSGSTTLLITNTNTSTDYFKGYVIAYNANTTDAVKVVASTVSGTTHTLTLSAGFPTNLTAGTDTIKLFNKVYVGYVYHEGSQVMNLVGFPREDSEGVIDPASPVNGNVPTYLNTQVNNLTANNITLSGTINYTAGKVLNTVTLTAAATLTYTQLTVDDIIYFNPTANATFTLPSIASMTFGSNISKVITFVNISNFSVTIAPNAADTIEGLSSLQLKRLYGKTSLIGSDQLTNTWTIKG